MTTGAIAAIPVYQFSSAAGAPLVNGTLETYLAGSTTPEPTYHDVALSAANPTTITLDGRGECVLFLDPAKAYKFVLKNSLGVTQWTQDNISSGSGAAITFIQSGANAIPRTVQDKLRESIPSSGDYSLVPAATTPNGWYWDYTNPDGAGQQQLVCDIPNTVSMTGGGAVQGVGLIFNGETSAQTPSAGLAETNMVRMAYTVNSDAGQKLQVHLINGTLIVAHDVGTTGNEGAVAIGTMRATGPAAGGANHAMGLWGADLHVEKTSGVAVGKMVGLEVGVHSGITLGADPVEDRENGVEVWSGNRSGITAQRAGNAIDLFGDAGWTNFIRARYTDGATEVFKLDASGNMTVLSPTGSQSTLFTTNQASTANTTQWQGRTAANAAVNAALQVDGAGGVVSIGTTTNHHFVINQNGAEVMRFISGWLWSSAAGVESTGAGSALLGANCPAVTVAAPYKWIKVRTSDGSTAYIPAWK